MTLAEADSFSTRTLAITEFLMLRYVHILLPVVMLPQSVAASQIVATVQYDVQGQFESSELCNSFTFTIGHAGDHALGDVLLTPWPPPFAWADGFSGSFDFTASFDEASFFHFTRMVEAVTDGIDDPMFFKGSVWECNHLLPPSPYILESALFQTSTDLVGNQVDLIRLHIDDLQLAEVGRQVLFDFSATYEFWGTPVPEPAALALLAPALIIVACRRHHRTPAATLTILRRSRRPSRA